MAKKLNSFNNKLAVIITKMVSSMWCAYIFAGIAIVTLPNAIRGGTTTLIPWIAQTFLQLVLLSIIMVGQDVQGQKTEQRAEQDHETIMAEFDEIKGLHNDVHGLIKSLHEKVDNVGQ
jgi:hypothetical protein